MDAMCKYGSVKLAAHALGVAQATIECQLSAAGKAIGAPTRLLKYLEWDRARRGGAFHLVSLTPTGDTISLDSGSRIMDLP